MAPLLVGFSAVNQRKRTLTVRRQFLRTCAALPLALASSAVALPAWAQAAPTPECRDGDDPTPRQMEGPFFKPRTPQRTSLLEPGLNGTRLVLTGSVLPTACNPLACPLRYSCKPANHS